MISATTRPENHIIVNAFSTESLLGIFTPWIDCITRSCQKNMNRCLFMKQSRDRCKVRFLFAIPDEVLPLYFPNAISQPTISPYAPPSMCIFSQQHHRLSKRPQGRIDNIGCTSILPIRPRPCDAHFLLGPDLPPGMHETKRRHVLVRDVRGIVHHNRELHEHPNTTTRSGT